MTRTALPLSLPPCLSNPDLWDSCDSADAVAICRRQCPRRFACAQQAITSPVEVLATLQGVIAGVVIPEDNAYSTSKTRRSALNQLKAVAEIGRNTTAGTAIGAAARMPRPSRKTPRRTLSPNTPEPTTPVIVWEDALDGAGPATLESARRIAEYRSIWGTGSPIRHDLPSGQLNTRGAAAMTGLTVGTLAVYRSEGRGPRFWKTSTGAVRYWVTDVQAWIDTRGHARNPQRTEHGVTSWHPEHTPEPIPHAS